MLFVKVEGISGGLENAYYASELMPKNIKKFNSDIIVIAIISGSIILVLSLVGLIIYKRRKHKYDTK